MKKNVKGMLLVFKNNSKFLFNGVIKGFYGLGFQIFFSVQFFDYGGIYSRV